MITYRKTNGSFWFRIFGYGIAITTKPRFSQRKGIVGMKIGRYYIEFLPPFNPQENQIRNDGYFPQSFEGSFREKIKQWLTGCHHEFSITAANGFGLPCEASCIKCGTYRHRILKADDLPRVPEWRQGRYPKPQQTK